MRQPIPATAGGPAAGQGTTAQGAASMAMARDVIARMDRLPVTAYMWKVIVLISLGGFFEFYDLFMTGYIAPGLIKSGIFVGATANVFAVNGFGAFIAATFLGLFIGTMFCGSLSDRYGRRSIFTYSLLFYTAANLLMSTQDTALGVNAFRLMAGIGLGLQMVTINAFVAELVPKDLRGRAFVITQVIPMCGVPTVACLSWWLVPQVPFGIEGWRWLLVISAVGAICVWFIQRALPESPRWLVSRGRTQQAQAVLHRIETIIEKEYGKPLPPATADVPASTLNHPKGSLGEIMRPPYLKRTIMLSVFNVLQVIGFYGFSNWIPTLLASKGFNLVHSLQYSFLMTLALPIGPLLFFYFADRIERKWTLVWVSAAIAILGLLFAHQTQTPGLVTFGLLMNLVLPILSYAFQVYQSELYPTEVRARAVGFVYSWSRLSSMFIGFLIAYVLHNYGVNAVFYVICTAMVLIMLLIGIMGPRTNGLALEDINH